MSDAPLSLSALPPGQWTVVAVPVERRLWTGAWVDSWEWLTREGAEEAQHEAQKEAEALREAGRLVTAQRREANGRLVLVARPVPPRLRRAFEAPVRSADRPSRARASSGRGGWG